MLSQALATASADGPRCVFVQMLVFGRTLAILRVASDDPEPRLSASIQLPDELPSLDELAADPNLPDMLDDGLGRALAAAVVDPLLADIAPGDRVVLCTTAPASRVPWHALPLADGRPWGARNVISQAPNATVLVRCLSQARPDGAALVIGDPTGDLPRGRDEARAIAEALGVTPLLGGEATLGAVAAALAGQAPALLHFACHGDVDEVDSTRSALLLAPEDPSDDGRLTVTALGGAALAGTRAFLSACDLAVADGPTRTEVFGMPRALLAAGAGAVVAGIWRVDDTATQLLMQRCHRDMATQPLADALASAQHWLRGLTVADVVAMAEAALAAELPQDRRARLLRHIAVEQVRAGDLPAAGATLRRLLADTDEDLAPAEHAQARHYLALLADVGDPLAPPDYAMRPFAPMRLWAPFVVTGDWR
ncbi:CHAT domain-containing protein [Mitsuaria sp. GD03876]|uniref:CHAT domain-containing protein n=1 Tax=Mitsuaria sp. GD03876 TaxID=2975399 RepID=UPI00244C2B86|nr:CHAT domain-containing protein [Mitsuaria sp. GD03876]MDH0865771.1 CHAT domain-containing protein [Mitsuaria sp. GD03876]